MTSGGSINNYLIHTFDSHFIVEPPLHRHQSHCLSISQDTHGLSLSVRPSASLSENSRIIPCEGILGTIHLLRGLYLVIIVRSSYVGDVGFRNSVHCVSQVELLPIPGDCAKLNGTDLHREKTLLQMVHDMFADNSMYFSYEYDLTNTLQRSASSGRVTMDVVDDRFCWNKHMAKDFKEHRLDQWVLPIISGFVQVSEPVLVSKTVIKYVLISRRGRGRQGTRFNVRGVDAKGSVANFVETEQIILPEASDSVYSYVQTRGSIPVLWSQFVSLKYMPRVSLSSNDSFPPFRQHFESEHSLDLYKAATAVNLIDKHGESGKVKDQRALGEAFEKQVTNLKSNVLKFTWFDFHHECRKMQWGNLSKLLDQVRDDLFNYGYYARSDENVVTQEQKGVMRTNCMDNLDRTNVVQSLFARVMLLAQIHEIETEHPVKLEDFTTPMESKDKQFESAFKNIWANNADVMSILYSGTPALKTDFTRTGKRTKLGAIKDGINSVTRYYLNNFRDGYRQDCVDLFLGNFDAHAEPYPSGTSGSWFTVVGYQVSLVLAEAFVFVSIVCAMLLSESNSFGTNLTYAMLLTVAVMAVYLHRVLTKGMEFKSKEDLISRPKFIPN